jgi:hypothetical protein
LTLTHAEIFRIIPLNQGYLMLAANAQSYLVVSSPEETVDL